MENQPVDLSHAEWRKSSRSNGNGGACVEVARNLAGIVAVRDSKDINGPALVFSPGGWRAFVVVSKAVSSATWGELGAHLSRSSRSMVMGKGTGAVRRSWWMPVRPYAWVAGSSS
ncbi:DUF397 domain-containing protein [Streptosporangium sp. NPDC001682]